MAKKKIVFETSLADDMTVREVERIYNDVLTNGIKMDDPELLSKSSAVSMWKKINMLRYSDKATMMKIRELKEWAKIVRSAFNKIHLVNYSTYNSMLNFYDWYEEKRRLNYNIKRFWRKTDDAYKRYLQEIYETQERSSYMLMQDYICLTNDSLQGCLSDVESTILNVFIRQRGNKKPVGQIDDIELLTKAQIPLLWARLMQHSYYLFFHYYIKECGIDFSYDFRYAELSAMIRNFYWMLEQMGIKLRGGEKNDKVLSYFDVDKSSTIEIAWNKVTKLMFDDDLADKKALEAINMNPLARMEYAETIRQEEDKHVSDGIEQLCEKFNVR